tara:strand:- start:113 stop:226 length:114 start_codon:yes stop_codon:yes gene_type:complete
MGVASGLGDRGVFQGGLAGGGWRLDSPENCFLRVKIL